MVRNQTTREARKKTLRKHAMFPELMLSAGKQRANKFSEIHGLRVPPISRNQAPMGFPRVAIKLFLPGAVGIIFRPAFRHA